MKTKLNKSLALFAQKESVKMTQFKSNKLNALSIEAFDRKTVYWNSK